jgi:hypothetical protein
MPIVIVGEERSFSQLRPRLFAGSVSRTAYRRVSEAVIAANPHIDMSRLEPGTVLTIPDLPEVKLRENLSTDEITKRMVEEVHDAFRKSMDTAQEQSAARAKADKADRTKVMAALKDPGVAKARRTDKRLAGDIEVVAAALDEEEERAKEGTAVLKKAVESWSADLDSLRELLG